MKIGDLIKQSRELHGRIIDLWKYIQNRKNKVQII